MPITTNILYRVLRLEFEGSRGTCFTIDYENRQYIVTAQHLVKDMPDSATIRIMHQQTWKKCPVNLVGHCADEIDISVLATNIQLTPKTSLGLTRAGLIFTQDVYLLGFPLGLYSEVPQLNRDFPLPFVKKAILSAMEVGNGLYWLDGHVNKGFSGGPVVFLPSERATGIDSVFAVISGFMTEKVRVFRDETDTGSYIKANAGIVACYYIKYAIDLIRQNPIGFNLPSEDK